MAQDIAVSDFVQQNHPHITITFETARNENQLAIKYYFEIEVEFYRNGSEEIDDFNLPDIMAQFMEKINGFSGQNSGWIISQIKYLRLCWGGYRLLMAGTFIPTPKWLSSKHAIVNVQCFDDVNCFQYSVSAGIDVTKSAYGAHKCCPSLYRPYMRMLNMDGIQTPVLLSPIDKFEKQNPDIS